MATSPAGSSENPSSLCHHFSTSFFSCAPIFSWAIPGGKLFTDRCFSASNIVTGRPRLALGAGLRVIDSIMFGFLEEILRGDRSVSAAGRWTAAAAGCPCDLTMCVNQARVAARPASLISISLQITPRRHCEAGKAITAPQNNHPPQLSFSGFHLLRRWA